MTRFAFFTKLIPMCFLSAEEDELGFEENEIITNIQKVRKKTSFFTYRKSVFIFRCTKNGGLVKLDPDQAYFRLTMLKKSNK